MAASESAVWTFFIRRWPAACRRPAAAAARYARRRSRLTAGGASPPLHSALDTESTSAGRFCVESLAPGRSQIDFSTHFRPQIASPEAI